MNKLGGKFVEVKEVCSDYFWLMPATPRYIENGEIKYITSRNIINGEIDFSDSKQISRESFYDISKNRPIYAEDIIIGMIGTIGGLAIIKESDIPFYGQNMYLIRLNQKVISIKYFYYYFSSQIIQNMLKSKKNNSNQGYLRADRILSLNIYLPSLDVQNEIVEVLDKFTELKAELKAELEARTKQYSYYE